MKKDSLGLYCSHESDKEVDASKNDVNSCLRFLYVKLRVVRNCSNLIEKRNDKMEKELQQRAPIYEALERFRRMRIVPFDVPGHKHGRGNPELVELLGEKCVGIDVNSMKPLDNLCHPVSVIKEAEELAADAFGAKHAFLMVGGTTSSVQAMVLSCCKKGDKIILPRNVHRSVINALVLCGAHPVYVNPDVDKELGISLGMKVSQVEQAIRENPDAVAVFVNNPTYYGICSDLKTIVKLAHEQDMKVLVDEAHGTHFYFGENLPISAMSFWPGMWRRAARARLRLKRRWTPGRWPRGQRNCCKRAARPPERCFGCGRRDIRSRRSHRGAASAKARPARWIFARATGCGSNCRRRGQSYENTNRARDTL